jgi:hypothetical protein
MAYGQQEVIEVVEYVDDDDYDGGDDFEEVVEVVEEVVVLPKNSFPAVSAWEVGLAKPPPTFLIRDPKQRDRWLREAYGEATQRTSSAGTAATRRRSSQKPGVLPAQRKASIINQALGIPDEVVEKEYEEYEEEIIEEEYYDEEIIEEEIIEEEYYDEEYEEEYYEEIIVAEETEEEAMARKQLEDEIAEIERQIAEAKASKEKRIAEGGCEETAGEKAQRMAHNSRLEACKQMKNESDFKRKAAARAKALAEREAGWTKKGKKKQKDLSEIIAAKAKKQQKLLTRQKSKDYQKKPREPEKEEKKVEEKPAEAAPKVEGEKKPLGLADMLVLKAARGPNAMAALKAKPTPQETKKEPQGYGADNDDLSEHDFLPSESEEEEEEEEKPLSPEEEHARRLQWEKPSWTQAKLKTTVKGTQVRKGKTLAAPITFIPKKVNEGLEEEEEEADDNNPSKGALMEGAIKMVMMPKVKKHHANLKFTGNGARIRDGRKIEKAINPKVQNKEEVKIWGADPEELKLTPRGLTVKKGKNLAETITDATQQKKYAFEKPDWTKTIPSKHLKHTQSGEALKEGQDLTDRPAMATQQKKYEFEKPSWTMAKLKSTDKGGKLKTGENLAKPIVDLDRKTLNVNLEANPAFLRMTDQGEKLMEDGNLEGPITFPVSIRKHSFPVSVKKALVSRSAPIIFFYITERQRLDFLSCDLFAWGQLCICEQIGLYVVDLIDNPFLVELRGMKSFKSLY